MEVDVSTIIGYVMKFNYALPYNASYLTDSYVRYDRSISPDGVEVDGDGEPNPDYQGITTPPLSLLSFVHQLPAFLVFPAKHPPPLSTLSPILQRSYPAPPFFSRESHEFSNSHESPLFVQL